MKPKEKTYEQFMEEALLKLPLYNKEWTNYNLSDPGITILENFTALTVLLQSFIYEENNQIKEALLKLAGFVKRRGSCAKVLLSAKNVSEDFALPIHQQFSLGDLIFETDRTTVVSHGKITGILYRDKNGSCLEYKELIKENPQFPVTVFTNQPSKGMELWFFMDALPQEEKELIYYMKTANIFERNSGNLEEETIQKPDFAEIEWQCYTQDGFVTLKALDETDGFLSDGRITFFLSDLKPAVKTERSYTGYVIRAVLKRADYDMPPRLLQVTGFLFEVCQKKTEAIAQTAEKTDHLSVYSNILEEEYYKLYIKKGDSYQLCRENDYSLFHDGYGMYTFAFFEEQEEILLTAYTKEMMQAYALGMIYGYDNEIVELPGQHIVENNFSILLEQKEEKTGISRYYLLYPDTPYENGFLYHLEAESGHIRILEAGDFTGCRLYLGGLAQSGGEQGNILPGKEFCPVGYESDIRFVNPSNGTGGCYEESIEELTARYEKDIQKVYPAVCARDYEQIVKNIPGLCIDKVRAYRKAGDTAIHIAVKPASIRQYAYLSKQYKKRITAVLEKRRLLGTEIVLEQPVYLPVHVYGKVVVKEPYANAKKLILNTISECIDYIHSQKSFGEILRFDKVFAAIEKLDCVEMIQNLSIKPGNLSLASMEGVNIAPDKNCLLYPGDIQIETDKGI